MTTFRFRLLPIALLVLAGWRTPLSAQTPDAGSWQLEEVVTKDGKAYRGLIYAAGEDELEFVEVVQPRGKPMYLVVRPIDKKLVVSQKRLPAAAREKLQDRVYAFRFRSRIEAGRMEDVELFQRKDSGRLYLRYHGPGFTMDSTADAETTRRCVVRIVQIFRAYRQMLPPRVESDRPLRVLLFASMDEYRAFLKQHSLEVTNPAVYSQSGNIVVAASELTRYARRLEITRQRHDELRQRYEQVDKELPGRLAQLRKRLNDAGFNRDAIRDEINARQAQWDAEKAELMQLLNAADRRNERRFDEVTDEMFRRLYHEAFHAYLENYLYPQDKYDVPVWLHEGLAQLFQSGQLEADTLRIDAPLASALRIAQENMRSDSPLTLAELLRADRDDFLAEGSDVQRANRLYAGAWALVYYLTFYEPLLGTEAFDEFIAASDDEDALLRFQALLDKPLSKFEQQWRETTLSLKEPG